MLDTAKHQAIRKFQLREKRSGWSLKSLTPNSAQGPKIYNPPPFRILFTNKFPNPTPMRIKFYFFAGVTENSLIKIIFFKIFKL